jgi:hypothetical protein
MFCSIIYKIQSFVVQNFTTKYPFLEKSYRYQYLILTTYYKILTTYLLYTIVYSFNLFKKLFNVFISFTYLYSFYKNHQLTNLILSTKFILFKILSNIVSFKKKIKCLSKPNTTVYLQASKHLCLPFSKNRLNSIFYLTIIVVISNYVNYRNIFYLKNLIVNFNTNMYLLTFINQFYFKIRNF